MSWIEHKDYDLIQFFIGIDMSTFVGAESYVF